MKLSLVAEIGINHNGKVDNALDLVEAFSFCDVIKIQKMTPKLFLNKQRYEAPHPEPKNAFAKSYGEHREKLELSKSDLKKIKKACDKERIEFAASVCDTQAVDDVIDLSPYYLKVPSCRSNHRGLFKHLEENWEGQLHVSSGMTTQKERWWIVNTNPNWIVYSCTSNYKNEGPVFIQDFPGFSCHVPDIFYAKFAIMQGARWIEYHVTLDKKQKGNDHKISLLPDEFKELKTWVEDNANKIERIQKKKPPTVPPNEQEARDKLWATT